MIAIDPLTLWTAEAFSALPWLAHGFTYRTDGVSESPFSSLNLGLHVGDNPEHVVENRRRTASALGFARDRMVTAEQVHGGVAAVASATDAGKGVTEFASTVPGADALVAATPDLLLTLFFADCVPVLFVAPEARVVAVAHAGWRGLVAGVLENTVRAICELASTTPDKLLAAVAPCIGPCCFEVGQEVADVFPEETRRAPEWPRPHVDLPAATVNRLVRAGLPQEKITTSGVCTSCSADYFSHRRDQGRTGRMAALIGIRPGA